MPYTQKIIEGGIINFTDGTFLNMGIYSYTSSGDFGKSAEYKHSKNNCCLLGYYDKVNDIRLGFIGEKYDIFGNKYIFEKNQISIQGANNGGIVTQYFTDTNNVIFIHKVVLQNAPGSYTLQTGFCDGYIPFYDSTTTYDKIATTDGTQFNIAEIAYNTSLSKNLFSGTLFEEDIIEISGVNYAVPRVNNDGFFDALLIEIKAKETRNTANTSNMENVASTWILEEVSGYIPSEPTGDPYEPGGTTNPGGGNGTFTGIGDKIPIPSLPSLSALDSGFITMYSPTIQQLSDLSTYLWTGAFDVNSFKKIFANPIEAFMGLGIIPLNPTLGPTVNVKVGNIDTGVTMPRVTTEFYEIDCGTLSIPERWGSYLDYEPYYTIDCFLPYIGSVRISTDDIKKQSGGNIKIVYHINILDGSCTAFLFINGSTAYQYNGSVLTQLPITGNDFRGVYQSILSLAGNIVGAVTSGVSGNAGAVLGNVASAVGNVMGSKPTVNRSGSISGSNGRLGVQKPYLVLNEPKPAIAWAQNLYQGYPSHVTSGLNTLTGYNEFEKVYLDNIPATDNELDEIKQILESGVML